MKDALYPFAGAAFFLIAVIAMDPAGFDGDAVAYALVILLSLGLFRLSLHFLRRFIGPYSPAYWSWCAFEILSATALVGLYSFVVYGTPFLQTVLPGLRYVALPLLFVSIPVNMAFALADGRSPKEAVPTHIPLHFKDSSGKLKLSVDVSAVSYIEADGNYVLIHYQDGGKNKEYRLRASMVSINDMVSKAGLYRCQKSFFVNPAHIKTLRRDSEGLTFAVLDSFEAGVPVSPKFHEGLSALL